jgi:hypothetical protein
MLQFLTGFLKTWNYQHEQQLLQSLYGLKFWTMVALWDRIYLGTLIFSPPPCIQVLAVGPFAELEKFSPDPINFFMMTKQVKFFRYLIKRSVLNTYTGVEV